MDRSDFGSGGDDEDTTPTAADPLTERRDPIEFVLSTATASEALVSLLVTKDTELVFEKNVTVAPNGEPLTIGTGIEELGEYQIEIDVEDGPEKSSQFVVEEYDLRMGSNVLVGISEEDVEILIEQ